MLSVEKVYDELYGMIEDLKKQIAANAGTDVTITPALESGTKVADFEIDGESGSLYAPAPYTPPAYSTTEFDTGRQWTDGRTVYGKVIDLSGLPNNTYKAVPHGIDNLDTVVAILGSAKNPTYIIPLPYVTTTATSCVDISFTATDIGVSTGTDRSDYTTAFIVVYYIKTPPEPEAKKTTKKK